MFAIVEAEMSIRPRAPRCNRSADSGAFVSVNGPCAASLMRSLPQTGSTLPWPRGGHNARELTDALLDPAQAAQTGSPRCQPQVPVSSPADNLTRAERRCLTGPKVPNQGP